MKMKHYIKLVIYGIIALCFTYIAIVHMISLQEDYKNSQSKQKTFQHITLVGSTTLAAGVSVHSTLAQVVHIGLLGDKTRNFLNFFTNTMLN